MANAWSKEIGRVPGFSEKYGYWIDRKNGAIHQVDPKNPDYIKHREERMAKKQETKEARAAKVLARAQRKADIAVRKAESKKLRSERASVKGELKIVNTKLKEVKAVDDFEKAKFFKDQKTILEAKLKGMKK